MSNTFRRQGCGDTAAVCADGGVKSLAHSSMGQALGGRLIAGAGDSVCKPGVWPRIYWS